MLELTKPTHPALVPQTGLGITDRIRAEFREMPGLSLTAPQVCRLWGLDSQTCETALSQLIEAGFLCCKPDGTYARISDLAIRPRMAKALIPVTDVPAARRASQ